MFYSDRVENINLTRNFRHFIAKIIYISLHVQGEVKETHVTQIEKKRSKFES